MITKICDHSERRIYWVKKKNFITGEMEDELIDEWVWTFVDIDLYRFKCTRCGEIQYYSQPMKNL